MLAELDPPEIQTILWETPLSILGNETNQALPYPTDALPSIIQNAVISYQQYGQQPLPLIACSALANVSLACQSLANVARDSLLTSPISLYFLVIAASGERKSAADHTFGEAIREWERKIRLQLSPEVKRARTLHDTWLAEKNALLAQIRRASFNSDDTQWLKDKLVALTEKEPIVPLLPMLFFEDTTQEAITEQLAQGWPSASLWSDEGSIALSSQGMQGNTAKFVATLNRLWDGKAFITHRKTTRSFTVTHRRLTVSLMLQPLVLQQLLGRQGGITRQSGFLARSLITYPESRMGERYYQEPPHSLDALQAFKQRVTNCLDESLHLDSTGCDRIPTISFSPQAKKTWIAFFNKVEKGLTNPAQWFTIKDFASKAAENVARLSALFHLFEGKHGLINSESVERAIQVIDWHLWETRELLKSEPELTHQQDALRLIQWLKNKGLTQATPRQIQQFGPLRNKKQRDDAIQYLMDTKHLKEGKIQGKMTLLINPKINNVLS